MKTSSSPPIARHVRPRPRRVGAIGVVMALVAAVLPALAVASPSQAASPTVVSFTFDDGYADQLPAAASLAANGMKGTFYVNTGTLGLDTIMTRTNLDSLKAAGHEIGGHTVSHTALPSVPAAEAKRQICIDRNNLVDWGFGPRSFAYPFADINATVVGLAQECGYNSARNLGDLKSRFGAADGPYAETIPPANAFETRALDQVDTSWTLQDFKDSVTNAENSTNGGWVQFTFHNICADAAATCPELSVRQSVFDEFVTWLKARPSSTTVKTVGDVVGGAVKAKVVPADPPPPTNGTGLTNPGFETVTSGTPECWTKGGFGSNTPVFDLASPGRTGTYAGRITIDDYVSGDAKYLQALDLGTCAPGATAGRSYTLSGWYTSTANTQFAVYRRNAAGGWEYWTSSPWFASASDWTNATWTTPEVPAGYTGISFGLNLFSNGTLTVDDYSIKAYASETTATVTPAAPTATGWYVTRPTVVLATTATSGWTIEYSLDGGPWTAYTGPLDVADGTHTLGYRSKTPTGILEDTKTLTLKVDTVKPVVTVAYEPVGRKLTATATDATSGVDTIEYRLAGAPAWTAYPTAGITVPDVQATQTYEFRATDKAGTVSDTVTKSVAPDLKTTATITPAAADGSNGWYRTKPTATVTKGGSTPTAEYSVFDGAWATYTAPVVIGDGQGTFRHRGANGSVKGEESSIPLKVDSTNPTVTPAFDRPTRTLTITASDATSGVDKREYRVSGAATWTTYTGPVKLSDATSATYQFRSTDKAGNVSATQTLQVKERRLMATVGLSLSPGVAKFGKASSARIVVTGQPGNPTPTGTVTVLVDGKAVATPALVGGVATVKLPADLRGGLHLVAATYAGDADTRPSISNLAVLVVVKVPANVKATLASSKIAAGSKPKVTASVSVRGTSVKPTGTVAFMVGGKTVKKVTLKASDRGKVTVRLPKVSRKGLYGVKAVFSRSTDAKADASKVRTLRVR